MCTICFCFYRRKLSQSRYAIAAAAVDGISTSSSSTRQHVAAHENATISADIELQEVDGATVVPDNAEIVSLSSVSSNVELLLNHSIVHFTAPSLANSHRTVELNAVIP